MNAINETAILNELPERFSRDEILRMCNELKKETDEESPRLSMKERVYRYAEKYKYLLFGMPFLYRTILMGTYREEVVNNILDARERMERGMSKEEALEKLIEKAVEEVTDIRQRRLVSR